MANNMGMNDANCHQLYQAIHERQKTAAMMHDQTADLFDFLGLHGFKRMFEKLYLCEAIKHRKTKRYFINHHGQLLATAELKEVDIIPDDWYRYTRNDVSVAIRKQYVEKTFGDYRAYLKETLDKFCLYAKSLLDIGYTADFSFVQCLADDLSCELKCLERLILKLESVKYSEEYIAEIQDEFHKKYKKAAKKLLE